MGKDNMLLNQSDLLRHYKNSSARLFLFDWDGTLTPIVRDPAAAVPTAPVLQALSAISSDPKNHFWIISGRDKTFLDTYFGSVPSIGLSAEHGAFVRRPHRTDWEDISGAADKAWQDGVIADLEKFTAKTPGSWIERKDIAITWHYRNAAPELGMLNSKECKQCVQEKISDSPYNLEIIEGKMCLEVRPRNLNKGAIVQRIMDDYKANHAQSLSPDFVFCIGDDVTDEDMFRNVRDSGLSTIQAFNVLVGSPSKLTIAPWYLLEPADVLELLQKLVLASAEPHNEL